MVFEIPQKVEIIINILEKAGYEAYAVAPTPAYKLGSMANDPLKMYLMDIFTVPLNLAGTQRSRRNDFTHK